MSIPLFGDYYFDRDKFNWILQVEKFSKKHQKMVIKNVAYFGNPMQMAAYIGQHAALNGAEGVTRLNELIAAVEALTAVAITSIRAKAAQPITPSDPALTREGIEMYDMPRFEEALRKQREAFADRYMANQELSEYVDGLFGDNEERNDD